MKTRRIRVLCLLVLMAGHCRTVHAHPQSEESRNNEVSSKQVIASNQLAGDEAINEFIQALENGRKDVQQQASQTTLLYIGLRVFLIVFATLAAFGKNFKATRLKILSNWIPIFTLLVAIGTGLDTFLKLGQRRSGHYNYISNVEDIEMRAKRIFGSTAMTLTQLQELEDRYSAVKAQHRRETAF